VFLKFFVPLLLSCSVQVMYFVLPNQFEDGSFTLLLSEKHP
jgi:hypothetical protein